MDDPNVPTQDAKSTPRARTGIVGWAVRVVLIVGLVWAGCRIALHYWGDRQLQQAERLIALRDFDGALPLLAGCRSTREADPEIWLLSGRTARRAGKFSEAVEFLNGAKHRGAKARDIALERLLIEAQQHGLAAAGEGLLEHLKPGLSYFPLVADVVSAEWMRTYRLADARDLLSHWAQREPHEVEVFVRRGWVAEHQLDFDNAALDYRRVLEMDPKRDAVRLRLIEILLKLRRPADAEPHVRELLQKSELGFDALKVTSRCYRELGKITEAAAALARIDAADRNEPWVMAESALVALDAGRPLDAEALFRKALPKLPREHAVLYGFQQCLARLGKTVEAETVAITLKEVDQDGRRIGQIIQELEKTPADVGLRFELGKLFLRNGLAEDGVRWLTMVLELVPAHRPTHELLADWHERNGRADLARRHREFTKESSTKSKGAP